MPYSSSTKTTMDLILCLILSLCSLAAKCFKMSSSFLAVNVLWYLEKKQHWKCRPFIITISPSSLKLNLVNNCNSFLTAMLYNVVFFCGSKITDMFLHSGDVKSLLPLTRVWFIRSSSSVEWKCFKNRSFYWHVVRSSSSLFVHDFKCRPPKHFIFHAVLSKR